MDKELEKKLKALSQISFAITSQRYTEDILKLIVTLTAEAMGFKICSLMFLDPKKGELSIKATQSVSGRYLKKPPIKPGEGVAGKVVKENKPYISSDVRNDPLYINREVAKAEGLCSLLSLPLSVKGSVIGVLNFYTSEKHEFTSSEINILESIANQAAIVIDNWRLMLETEVMKEELQTRKRVEKAKGILMKEEGLTEDAAYNLMRKYSMKTRKQMKEIAESIIVSYEVKDRRQKTEDK
ncbi:MAG: GAF domain-containing protein [Candidatus Ratteibacteria bacterium]|nr:GAF domain-containing protein [Candidatus Ratteibacteria bacterium]